MPTCASAHTKRIGDGNITISSPSECELDNSKATNVARAGAIPWFSPVLGPVELSVSGKLPSVEETAVQGRAKTFAPPPLVEFSTTLDGDKNKSGHGEDLRAFVLLYGCLGVQQHATG